MNLKQTAALVLLATVWGGSFFFIRIAAPALGPLPLMMLRVTLAAAALCTVASVMRAPVRLRPHVRGLLFLGAVNAAIPFTLIAWAELRLTASLAAMLNAAVPLFTAVVSAVWLRERITREHGFGLLLGFAGVAVLVGWSPIALTTRTVLSVIAMLSAALCYAVAAVFTKRRLSDASAPTLATGQQLTAAAWLALPALLYLPPEAPAPAALWSLLGLALLSTALAYLLYFYLIGTVGPTKTNSVTFLIPIFGMTWGVLFLDEPITAGMLSGLACILASLVLVNDIRFRRIHEHRTTSSPHRVLTQP